MSRGLDKLTPMDRVRPLQRNSTARQHDRDSLLGEFVIGKYPAKG